MMRSIVITSADEINFSLTKDWLASLKGLHFSFPFDLGIIDLGLTSSARHFFHDKGVLLKRVEESSAPSQRSVRPFMRRYFADYDVYIWLDPLVWLQTTDAIDAMIEGVQKNSALHICSEYDRCYSSYFQSTALWPTYRSWYGSAFGSQVAEAMTLKPMFNAGVFAMGRHTIGWDTWCDLYEKTPQNSVTANEQEVLTDQLGLNVLIHQGTIPTVIMPAHFNWLTHHALPKFDPVRCQYTDALPPYNSLSLIHLDQKIATQPKKIQKLDGSFMELPLTFSACPRAA